MKSSNVGLLKPKLRFNKLFRFLFAPLILSWRWIEKITFPFTASSKYIQSFHNVHEGETCFIIGNGPSLLASDLDRIHDQGILSFGCNKIYQIFDKTNWRPDFYMCIDYSCLKMEHDNIACLKGPIKFARNIPGIEAFSHDDRVHRIIQYDKYQINVNKFKKQQISEDCSKHFSLANATVTCVEIEFAIYMGFRTIYLLGVDHNYSGSIDEKGNSTKNEIESDHFEGADCGEKELNMIYIDAATSCYQLYRDYADAHNIQIINATRGGMLEVFYRKSINDILPL